MFQAFGATLMLVDETKVLQIPISTAVSSERKIFWGKKGSRRTT